MAGLGAEVKSAYTMRSRMNGTAMLGGSAYQTWFFDRDGSLSGFMSDRKLPSAHLEVIEGQPTTIEFTNTSPMPHTIHLHGLDVDQANDGVPQTSAAVAPFESFTYQFVAPHAGTYHYHCHVDTIVHYHRGMAGAIIVRPPGGATNLAWKGGPTFDEEVLWHLQTFDTTWGNVTTSGPATARHRPDVFLLNGLESADAAADPFTRIEVPVGTAVYARLVHTGYQWARVSFGGLPFQVVASDGRPMRQSVTADTWELGPGERYDVLLTPTEPAVLSANVAYLDDYTGAVLGAVSTDLIVTAP
jgi:FtsP/CotA-like multicopper oxidase with cupredoxin domain